MFGLGDGRAGETLEFGRLEGRQLERGGQIETNVSTDRAIMNILRQHSENDVFTTYVQPGYHKHRQVIKTMQWKHYTQDCVNNAGTVAHCIVIRYNCVNMTSLLIRF